MQFKSLTLREPLDYVKLIGELNTDANPYPLASGTVIKIYHQHIYDSVHW